MDRSTKRAWGSLTRVCDGRSAAPCRVRERGEVGINNREERERWTGRGGSHKRVQVVIDRQVSGVGSSACVGVAGENGERTGEDKAKSEEVNECRLIDGDHVQQVL